MPEACPSEGNKLYVINRDGTNLVNMELSTKDLVPGCSPVSWSPDGKALAIAFRRAVISGVSETEIYIVDAIGNNLRKLTHQNGTTDAINWTHDGKSIVFADGDKNVIYSLR